MKRNFFSTLRLLFGLKDIRNQRIRESEARVIDILRSRLNTFMLQQQPYLQEHYSLKDLSDDMNIPLHQLSAFLNKHVGMHFNDYLNQFRIRYCEELIKKETPGRVNLKELVYKCGFHNRNTFASAFKKFTGKTPSDYVRERERAQR